MQNTHEDRDLLAADILAIAEEANILLGDGGGTPEERASFLERKRRVLDRMEIAVRSGSRSNERLGD